jgi:hypothetical protein
MLEWLVLLQKCKKYDVTSENQAKTNMLFNAWKSRFGKATDVFPLPTSL